jgi:hypothetical protein
LAGQEMKRTHSNKSQLDKSGNDHVLWTHDAFDTANVPLGGMLDEVPLRKHPMSAGLGAQTPVMNEENQIGAFSIATFQFLDVRLVWWRMRHIPV